MPSVFIRRTLLALLTVSAMAQNSAFQLVRSQSGPSGTVVSGKLVLESVRSRFVCPQDKSFVVYFEWRGPQGDHVLSAIWKGPDGRVITMSPEIRMRTEAPEFGAYWAFEPSPGMPSGYWSVEIRIDGQPAGSHAFELVMPAAAAEPPAAPTEPPKPSPPSTDAIYRTVRNSMVWVYRLDDAGRRADTASGFVLAPGQVATAFQIVDSAPQLEVEFEDGRRLPVDTLRGYSRLEDWAILNVETRGAQPLPLGDPEKVAVADRLLVFQVENGRVRAFGGVDISGSRTVPSFGERIQFMPSVAPEAVGGPLLSTEGKVVGVLGGSTLPGSRFGHKNLSVNPSLFFSMSANSAATPITLVRAAAAPLTIQNLHSEGVMSRPVVSMPSFQLGGTSLALKNVPPLALPPSVSEFSRKDPEVWVYSLWQRKDKLSKGMVSAEVYDPQNRVRVRVAPKKINIPIDAPLQYGFTFPTASLPAGSYRIDLLFDGQAVWRTFITITD